MFSAGLYDITNGRICGGFSKFYHSVCRVVTIHQFEKYRHIFTNASEGVCSDHLGDKTIY